MPISLPFEFRRISQKEFGELSFSVMEHIFAVHNDFGRFFDERIYKQELASRVKDVALEVPVTVRSGTFTKVYYLDAIVASGGLFEFKAVDEIHQRHRGQTINYLMLADLEHAKIVNLRPEKVQHEFVNCSKRLAELRQPRIIEVNWDGAVPGATRFRDLLSELIGDWGTGLELALYEEALSFLLGGGMGNAVVPVFGSRGHIGSQRIRLVTPETAFKVTALLEADNAFEVHARRLLAHTSLKAIHWVNITYQEVTFTTIR